jgi:hypothetical protein
MLPIIVSEMKGQMFGSNALGIVRQPVAAEFIFSFFVGGQGLDKIRVQYNTILVRHAGATDKFRCLVILEGLWMTVLLTIHVKRTGASADFCSEGLQYIIKYYIYWYNSSVCYCTS